MTVGIWELASVAGKWLGLLATAGVVGGSFGVALARSQRFSEQPELRRYLRLSAVLGLLVVPVYFLLQVGAVNQSGVAGMFDPLMGRILLQSGLGQVLGVRMLAFALVALWLLCPVPVAISYRRQAERIVCASATLLLAGSFVLTGHISTLTLVARGVLALHVLMVFLWIGALYPLLQLSRTRDIQQVQTLMQRFGVLALGIVALLLVSGMWLATQVLQAPTDLATTAYGRTLLLKLVGVSGLLLIAAGNKLVLVPKLATTGSAATLQTYIRIEIGVALLVLAVTSWLTTITGPA